MDGKGQKKRDKGLKIGLFGVKLFDIVGIVVYLQRKNDIHNPQNIITMKEIIEKVAAAYAVFSKDAGLQAEQGNKAAGARARKASLEIEKAMKEFRKASIAAAKK